MVPEDDFPQMKFQSGIVSSNTSSGASVRRVAQKPASPIECPLGRRLILSPGKDEI